MFPHMKCDSAKGLDTSSLLFCTMPFSQSEFSKRYVLLIPFVKSNNSIELLRQKANIVCLYQW